MTRHRFVWLGVVLFVAAAGFGPVWVAAENAKNTLAVQCASAGYNIAQLAATELTLRAQSQIAHDLGLPVAVEIDAALSDYPHPTLPPECTSG
jgi:hypothetical protein